MLKFNKQIIAILIASMLITPISILVVTTREGGTVAASPGENYLWISDGGDFIYQVTTSDPETIVDNYDFDTSSPFGVEENNGYIFFVDYGTDTLYKKLWSDKSEDNSWSIGGYSGNPAGLAYGGGWFWIADYSDDQIYKVDPADPTTYVYIVTYTGINQPEGLGWNSDNSRLLVADSGSNLFYSFDVSGVPDSGQGTTNLTPDWTRSPPSGYPNSIVWDGTYFWTTDDGNNNMYKHNADMSVAATYDPPGSDPQGLAFGTPPPSSWLSGWGYRMLITIDSDNVDAELENFPILVHLDSTYTDFWAHCDSARNIAFTLSDGTTKLYRDIEQFDNVNDNLNAHVKVPSISSSVDTELYIYYDSSAPTHGETNDNETWDDNFVGVWHMDDNIGSITEVSKRNETLINVVEKHQAIYHPDYDAVYIIGGINRDENVEYDNVEKWVVGSEPIAVANLDNVVSQFGAALNTDDGKIYIYGGGQPDRPMLDEIQWFDPSDNTTGTLTETLPIKLVRTTAAYSPARDAMYIFGGTDYTEGETQQDFILKHDFVGDNVTELTATLQIANRAHVSIYVPLTEKIYVFGGEFNDIIQVFDPSDESITTLGETLPQDFGSDSTSGYWNPVEEKVYLFGGKYGSGDYRRDIVIFDPLDNTTVFEQNILPFATDDFPAVWNPENDQGYLVGYPDALVLGERMSDEIWNVNRNEVAGVGIADSTSNNNDGTKSGVDEPLEIDGKIAKSQDFGAKEYDVNILHSAELSLQTLTLEAWVVLDATGGYLGILAKRSDALRNYYFGTSNSDEVRFYLQETGGAGSDHRGDATLTTGIWYYMVATYDGSEQMVYLDGSADGAATEWSETLYTGSVPIRFGRDGSGGDLSWNGKLDEIRISNVVRSAAWIDATYNSGSDSLLSYGSEQAAPVEGDEYERGVSQGFTLTGTAPRGIEAGRGINQGFSVGATVVIMVEFFRLVSGAFSLTGVVGFIVGWGRSPAQGFSIGAGVEIDAEYSRPISQGFSISGSVVAIKEVALAVPQAFTFTGAVTANMERWGSIDPAFSFDATVGIEVQKPEIEIDIPQGFTLTGTVTAKTEQHESLDQGFSFTGSVEATREFAGAISQGFSFTAEVSANMERLGAIDQTFSFTGAVEAVVDRFTQEFERPVEQGFSFTADVSIGMEWWTPIDQAFSINAVVDADVEKPELERNVPQGFALTGAVAANTEHGKSLDQTFSFTGTVEGEASFTGELDGEFSFNATIGIEVEKPAIEIDIPQGFSLAGTVVANAERSGSLDQGFSLGGTVEATRGSDRFISQGFAFAESITVEKEIAIGLSGGFSFSATVAAPTEGERELSGALSFTGGVVAGPEYGRSSSGAFSFNATVGIEVQTGAIEVERDIDQPFSISGEVERTIPIPTPPFDWRATAMFIFPIVLMAFAFVFDSPVFASFAGIVFIISGFYFVDIIWLVIVFIGIGIYLLITAFMSKRD